MFDKQELEILEYLLKVALHSTTPPIYGELRQRHYDLLVKVRRMKEGENGSD